jgi:hypothetical protein
MTLLDLLQLANTGYPDHFLDEYYDPEMGADNADGTRAVSTWSPTLQQWQTTVTPPPGQTCTGQMNPRTRQWEGHCR